MAAEGRPLLFLVRRAVNVGQQCQNKDSLGSVVGPAGVLSFRWRSGARAGLPRTEEYYFLVSGAVAGDGNSGLVWSSFDSVVVAAAG